MPFTCEQHEGLRWGNCVLVIVADIEFARVSQCTYVMITGHTTGGDSRSSRMGGIIMGETHAFDTRGEIHFLAILVPVTACCVITCALPHGPDLSMSNKTEWSLTAGSAAAALLC